MTTLPKFDIVQTLQSSGLLTEIYAPIWSKIRCYGDIENPIFVAKDVQTALGLKDMGYKREDGIFNWGRDKVKIKAETAGGMQTVVALTENGFNKACFHSSTPEALNFQDYVATVLKQLRIRGRVELQNLADELAKHKAYIQNLEEQIEPLQIKLTELQEHNDALFNDNLTTHVEKRKLKALVDDDPYKERVQRLETRLQKIYAEHGKCYVLCIFVEPGDTDAAAVEPWSDDLDPAMVYTWTLTTADGWRKLKSLTPVKRIFAMNIKSLDALITKFKNWNEPARVATHWSSSLENIEDQITDGDL